MCRTRTQKTKNENYCTRQRRQPQQNKCQPRSLAKRQQRELISPGWERWDMTVCELLVTAHRHGAHDQIHPTQRKQHGERAAIDWSTNHRPNTSENDGEKDKKKKKTAQRIRGFLHTKDHDTVTKDARTNSYPWVRRRQRRNTQKKKCGGSSWLP